MKKKYLFIILFLITFLIILASFILFRIYSPKEISKEYTAVVLNLDDSSLIETTTIRLDGVIKKNLPIKSKFPIFKGRVKIDSIPLTLQKDKQMNDLGFFKIDNITYMSSALSYVRYKAKTTDFSVYTIGVMYTKNLKMDKFVIVLSQDNNINQCLVAPASNLQEGLEIYKSIMTR